VDVLGASQVEQRLGGSSSSGCWLLSMINAKELEQRFVWGDLIKGMKSLFEIRNLEI